MAGAGEKRRAAQGGNGGGRPQRAAAEAGRTSSPSRSFSRRWRARRTRRLDKTARRAQAPPSLPQLQVSTNMRYTAPLQQKRSARRPPATNHGRRGHSGDAVPSPMGPVCCQARARRGSRPCSTRAAPAPSAGRRALPPYAPIGALLSTHCPVRLSPPASGARLRHSSSADWHKSTKSPFGRAA